MLWKPLFPIGVKMGSVLGCIKKILQACEAEHPLQRRPEENALQALQAVFSSAGYAEQVVSVVGRNRTFQGPFREARLNFVYCGML